MLSKNKALKRKEDIRSFFVSLMESSHKLELIVNSEPASSFIVKVNDFLLINQVQPLYLNDNMTEGMNVNIFLEQLKNFELFKYTFSTKIKNVEFDYRSKFYSLAIPDKIKYTKRDYNIIPPVTDKVFLTFEIERAEYIREVLKITKNEIYFEGILNPHKCDNKVLYKVFISFPFGKTRFSGVIRTVKNHCILTDYMVNEDIKDAIARYSDDYFSRKKHFYKSILTKEHTEDVKEVNVPNKKIIIVDDSKTVTEVLQEIVLVRTNYDVITLNDPFEAYDAIAKEKPLLAVIDCKMPGKSGIDIVKELRCNSEFNYLKIILLTLPGFDINYEDMQLLNIEDYLEKPVDTNDFIIKVKEIMENEK